MGRLLQSYIFPHPPVAIPEIGKNNAIRVKQTTDACMSAAKQISEMQPTTIIVTTPHGAVFQDAVCISIQPEIEGNFVDFGCPKINYKFDNNCDLANNIIRKAKENGIEVAELSDVLASTYGLSGKLDHGALVPLHFIRQWAGNFKLVHISIGLIPFEELYLFGKCIADAIEQSDDNVVFIGSGDLSHRLTRNAPAGYNPKAKDFDNSLVKHIADSNVEQIIYMDKNLIERAGECGLRSFIIMYGALDGKLLDSEVISYQAPFGVGYCVAAIKPIQPSAERQIINNIFRNRSKAIEDVRREEDSYTALARIALETYVNKGMVITPQQLDLPEKMLCNRAGTFVSIKKHGELRGCIGTIAATCSSIAEEIINNAISAGTRDTRFVPIQSQELEQLIYSVDVLKQPEPISSKQQLDPTRYGVIVSKGMRKGLLLPNIEGIDTVEEQISIALKKAGIRDSETYSMQRFEVIRHK